MKILTKILLLCTICIATVSSAENLEAEKKVESQSHESPSICYGTVLSSHNQIFYSFCLTTDSEIVVSEYSTKSWGVKRPYRCWGEGEYKGAISTNDLKIQSNKGSCNNKKTMKAYNLSCKSKSEKELSCEFEHENGKNYRFTEARIVKKVDRKLCENDNNYFALHSVKCKMSFGMKGGFEQNRQQRIRLRAEQRHRNN